jgi:hypothetical protein
LKDWPAIHDHTLRHHYSFGADIAPCHFGFFDKELGVALKEGEGMRPRIAHLGNCRASRR